MNHQLAAVDSVEINDRTRIGLYAVLGTVPFIVGAMFWLTMMYYKVEAAEKLNERQDNKIDTQTALLIDIRDRLTRVEEKLNRGRN